MARRREPSYVEEPEEKPAAQGRGHAVALYMVMENVRLFKNSQIVAPAESPTEA
jgi:hypothetical protein